MRFTYENQGTNTFLVYTIDEQDQLDSMSLGMLTNNKIPGLASASFTQMDMTKYIKYNVSAKVSVSQLFSGPVNKKRLVGVFSGIIDAMLSAEEYMIDPGTVILDLDYIFADVSSCETVLICLPVMDELRPQVDLGMFFKNIIFRTQFDQTENCDHVAKIINYLNGAVKLSLEDFKAVLNELDQVPVHPVQQVEQAQPVVIKAKPQTESVAQHVQPPVVNVPPAPTGQPSVPAQSNSGKFADLKFGGNYPQHPHGKASIPPQKDLPPAPQMEKPMSMFYLLQHYNKENAAIYKAQQDAKKGQKDSGGKKKPEKNVKPVKQTPPKKQPNVGFAVPGQTVNAAPGFTVPGRQAAPSQPSQPQYPSAPPVRKVQGVDQPPAQPPVQPTPQTAVQYTQQPNTGTPINFGATVVLSNNMGETTVLAGAAEQSKTNPHLIRLKNNEKIPLNKPVFRIGKEKSYVDYFISDNTAVSRSHANIINRDGEFFVVDTNSTNHTFVNGGMIHSNVETRLSHGTKLRFANEEFEFRLV